ncbi:MAG: HlyD family efflux transporter periplasmic adaptor subunit [Polyangiaceae bacterium]|nr:HlyD family efflux transporter periplasmic adaptor subunit [Polyangiaceae bacterium]
MVKNWRPRNYVYLAVVVGLGGCARLGSNGEPEGYQGVVEFEERSLGFEFAGRVESIAVVRGQTVAKGDVLAKLDDTLERATREARVGEAAVASADLLLVQSGARSEDVRATLARLSASRATELQLSQAVERDLKLVTAGAISQAVLEQSQTRLAQAKGEREALEQTLRAMNNGSRPQEVKRALAREHASATLVNLEDVRLRHHVLRAPLGGQVLEVHVEPGEVVGASVPVVTVADVDAPYANVFVPQSEIATLKQGAEVKVRVDSLGAALKAKVEFISPRTEFTPRFLFSEKERPNLVIRVRVRITDPGHLLRAGVPAFVTLSEPKQGSK